MFWLFCPLSDEFGRTARGSSCRMRGVAGSQTASAAHGHGIILPRGMSASALFIGCCRRQPRERWPCATLHERVPPPPGVETFFRILDTHTHTLSAWLRSSGDAFHASMQRHEKCIQKQVDGEEARSLVCAAAHTGLMFVILNMKPFQAWTSQLHIPL